jgi:transcriptional regulator with XRE-family HTH domain
MSRRNIKNTELNERAQKYLICIGKKLCDLRKSNGKSIRAVAKATKMSRSIISKLEKGQYENFGLNRFSDLCKYYNVQMVDIVECD